MRLLRFYFPATLSDGEHYTLPDKVFRHAVKVLRLTENDEFTLFNGDGKEYRSRLIRIDKKSAQVEILSSEQLSRESQLKIHLIQGVSKGERMDFVLQKATELGVSSIHPVFTERTNVAIPQVRIEKKLEHWRGVVTSACEQCGRNTIPEIFPPDSIIPVLKQFSEEVTSKVVLSPSATSGLLMQPKQQSGLIVLIGAEGGLSPAELRQAVELGFAEVSLGPRILRTETAALAFLAIAQGMWGDLT